MACCGGGGRIARRQTIERPQKENKQVPVQRISRQSSTEPIRVERPPSVQAQRQAVIKDDRCVKCGYTVMYVNIAGRERRQCTNANCRFIVK